MKKRKNNISGTFPSKPQKDPIHAAADYGIDIPMLMANLARIPAERIRRHQIALEAFRMLHRVNVVPYNKQIAVTGAAIWTHILSE